MDNKKDLCLLIGLSMIVLPCAFISGWMMVDLFKLSPKWAIGLIVGFIYLFVALILIEKGSKNE